MIELVVVIAVMLIISNAAALSVSSVDRRSLNRACIELQGDLRYAQRMAVLEGKIYQVVFMPVERKYCLYQITNKTSGLAEMVLVKEKQFDKNMNLETNASQSKVTYTYSGTTGDACTIVIKNDRYEAEMTINVGSGRIVLKNIKQI